MRNRYFNLDMLFTGFVLLISIINYIILFFEYIILKLHFTVDLFNEIEQSCHFLSN